MASINGNPNHFSVKTATSYFTLDNTLVRKWDDGLVAQEWDEPTWGDAFDKMRLLTGLNLVVVGDKVIAQ